LKLNDNTLSNISFNGDVDGLLASMGLVSEVELELAA